MEAASSHLILSVSPQGRPYLRETSADGASETIPAVAVRRIRDAFAAGTGPALLHLATTELQTALPASLAFLREFGQGYLTRLCHTPDVQGAETSAPPPMPPPAVEELTFTVMRAPPLDGLEYLNAGVLAEWWTELDAHFRAEAAKHPGGMQAYLRERSPLWRLVGRVTFHLAENKRDPDHPFAFMASYASKLSAQARPRHLPLRQALQEYGEAKDKSALLSLLTPIQCAAERSELAKELVDSSQVYQAQAWTPRQAYRFLQDIPLFEEAGLVVKVPDWWRQNRPPRPQVNVKIGDAAKTAIGVDTLLDFSVGVTLEGESLTEAEMQQLLQAHGGLVALRGKWVEVDREKLDAALQHWKKVERDARAGGVTFFEGMRMLAGVGLGDDEAAKVPDAIREWSGVVAGDTLSHAMAELQDPQAAGNAPPAGLKGTLRPYQQAGFGWLKFVTRLGLGACLADDMGLGKTIQVLSLLLEIRRQREAEPSGRKGPPSLLVVPASLIANWKAEAAKFAPSLSVQIVHPSESRAFVAKRNGDGTSEADQADANSDAADPADVLTAEDLVITTYGMLHRLEWLRKQEWKLLILDEAQAIKNSGTRQARAVKEVKSAGRVALTGTPIENRLSDLWSLFDFLNPGLLGGAKAFGKFVKGLSAQTENAYGPLRTLVRPYILRRLKTDKHIISDLPDKTEVTAWCGLTKVQAALYEQSVRELADRLKESEGIQRRGIVLAYLMRFKQICNHPSQWKADGAYVPEQSGKFHRLGELCEEMAARQEKALVFTQFREMTSPLADYLQTIFGRPGLVLHGGTAVGKRRELVDAFQQDDGPPFFVLSLKAGGTGLNLTAASQVIHFDRWWNPAVENQATDRAFRIGQKRNVLVHKFVCRGTVEEQIDKLIAEKTGLSRDLLEGGAEQLLTEMNDKELMRFVALDIRAAQEN